MSSNPASSSGQRSFGIAQNWKALDRHEVGAGEGGSNRAGVRELGIRSKMRQMRLTVHMSLFSFKLVRRITDYTWHLENSSCQNCQSVGDWFLSITCRTKKLRDRKDLWGHATHFKPHSINKPTCSNQHLRAQGKFIIIFCWCNRKDEEEQHLFIHSIISLIYSTTFPPPLYQQCSAEFVPGQGLGSDDTKMC